MRNKNIRDRNKQYTVAGYSNMEIEKNRPPRLFNDDGGQMESKVGNLLSGLYLGSLQDLASGANYDFFHRYLGTG